ncbi:hypothetical protein NWE61_04100 [Mycoplasmopsis felis]|nr:hypothetical protein [Mycoplasmopsis felis]MCU9934309.1 hypothetical protein [Mycoplasmopsis felis]
MKALLDKFFAENTNVGNTVEFTSMSIFSNYNPNYKTAHEEQVKVLNALDPRLKVHYRFETQRDHLLIITSIVQYHLDVQVEDMILI